MTAVAYLVFCKKLTVMKRYQLLSMLVAFPLIGIGLPDLMLWVSDENYQLPLSHTVILVHLLLVIVSVLFINRGKRNNDTRFA